MNYEQLLDELKREEEELQFDSFTNETALQIGLGLIDQAKLENKSITIDIRKGEQQLFHYAFPGTSADNDDWVMRKARVVNRFGVSSYRMEIELRAAGTTLAERYSLSPSLYAPYNGAYPIYARGFGVIGTIAVSGLPDDQDHKLITSVLRNILKRA